MNLNLQNKRAIVCGSTQGIGKAIAVELAQLGANVTLAARNEDKLRTALEDLDTTMGQQHDYIVADFTDPYNLNIQVQGYLAQQPTVHILVNNTGGPAGGPITEAISDEFMDAFNQHLIANHLLAKAVIPGMKAANYGRIINIISTSVKQPLHGLGVSNTIRGAVASWAKTMANELGQFGITVNNVLPGATRTGRLESIIENKARKTTTEVGTIEEEMMKEIPARRFAEPEEVAAAAAFLATPAAAYINGINVPVDGGRTGCL
ncbi:SDR family oxidoreductase [Pontibacter sp. BT310]|uniref:SDR family oxidoreductase n=1 Tax=Pontibacter populi TaxID=890055 RepID=A0ABS6XAY3_9BACT|nr:MULTISPECIES: SDR family oxidoreductase [Pontibacter]MBJ6117487.1 SDR family oxidoreductase [Pontibacter sp. BT310]MBR0569912.1 SDR family oxidoreductase [Microvirga sp. STS03]MBW3364340.1 SDR family oxidoreductase [Pontibacter populi]